MSTAPDSRAEWLHILRNARSVAIVGASEDERRPGGRVLAALERYGFTGRIHPVNPGRTVIKGLACVPSIAHLGEPVDIAFIAVAAAQVPVVVRQCVERGVSLIVIGAAGFAESGPAGRALQDQVMAEARRGGGVRVLGPNTNGALSVANGAVLTFSPALQLPGLELVPGPAVIVAQSGALGAATFALAQTAGLEVGLMINTGNEADISFEEVLEAVCGPAEEPRVVLGYLEGLSDAPRFVRAVRQAAERGVQVVLLKVGTTERGAAAAAAHTAKLAGTDRTFGGVLRQLGVIRADSLSSLTQLGVCAMSHRPVRGGRITIASLSGGLGIILADAAQALGLELAEWPEPWQEQLGLPGYLARGNPIDLGGGPFWDMDQLSHVVRTLDANPYSDLTLLAIANFEARQDLITATLAGLELTKPLVVVWYGNAERGRRMLIGAGIPAYAEPRDAVHAVAAVALRHIGSIVTDGDIPVDRERQKRVAALVASSAEQLSAEVGIAVLRAYGIPAADQRSWPIDADQPADPIPAPCYLKLVAPALAHKSDVGGVVLVQHQSEVTAGIAGLRAVARRLDLVDAELVSQERVPPGSELLLGMAQDPLFGPVVTVGLGGVLAEALDDVAVRLPALRADDVEDMLAQLRHRALVQGFRHLPPAVTKPVIEVVMAFAALVREIGHLFEAIDINPVIVDESAAATAVDFLFVLRARPQVRS